MSLATIAERHRAARERLELSGGVTLRRSGEAASTPILRVRSRLPRLDEALGGGWVRGGVYLLHGPPGSGKSTLLGQSALNIPGSVYVSSEESEDQIAHRFVRLGSRDQYVLAEKDITRALAMCGSPPFVVIDSVSGMSAGIMATAEQIVEYAQCRRVAVAMICHETKSGIHAGPRALEHLIDCSIKLNREPRSLVVEKNRFGPAPVVVDMEMTGKGFT